uniref:RRM domain-containing protein n=1 Tax=Castor canadensis TaxID=51338 RepID=A0A8C0X6M6_CASCN
MWPFVSHTLFPAPTEAWLHTVSSDPEAQGWGAWSRTPLEPRGGDGKEEKNGVAEEDGDEDTSFLLSLLVPENLAMSPVPDSELKAIRLKLWAMEQAEGLLGLPSGQREARKKGTGARQLLSPETTGCPFPGSPKENAEADHRSIFVGNVDYGGTAKELKAYFNHCGEIHRVTILCDKFSGHPKGYAYIEFASQSSAQAAVELDKSVFRGRIIKVLPKRTNFPGISSTDRGGLRFYPGPRATTLPPSSLQDRPWIRARGRGGCGKVSVWFTPY